MPHLELPDGTLAYDDHGHGPLVAMVPGLGDLRQEYRLLAPRVVDAGYRAVTVDLRGHGGSSVDWPSYGSDDAGRDLVALLERLDGGPALVVGNSFGAGAAVWAAAERPDLVRGVALLGPFVRDHPTNPLARLAMAAAFHGPWKVRAWCAYYGTLFPAAKPADFDEHVAALRANLAEPGRFAALRAMTNRSDAAIEARLPRVTRPALVVMGTADPDFPDPAEEAAWIASRLRGRTFLVEGAGHYPQTEMPDEVAPVLLDFFAEARRAA